MSFERATTGLPGLDQVIDGLRLGDNVVWQVDSVDDYRHFAAPFLKQALVDKKRLVYFRFGQHAPIIEETSDGLRIYELDAGNGFEHFSSEIHTIVTREGEEVYYIFDCLSDLLSEWSNDLMIGNFFKVTCPYLYKLRTIAFFALLRQSHSYQTVARIRDTTQLLLDVYHKGHRYYVHPLKVWKRYSPSMFLPHAAVNGEFKPLTSSADVVNLFALYPQRGLGSIGQKLDYWEHVFLNAAEITGLATTGDPETAEKRAMVLEQLLGMVIGRDEKILALARKYFTLADLLQIKSRLIGSGFIGGKAVGVLLARAILAADESSDWNSILEPHDSFYIGSDVYYTYLVENDCWDLRQQQRSPKHYFSAAADLRDRIKNGSFPENVRDQLQAMLEYFGQSPMIIRSSSLLEDGFGNAFAGKYESIFCANQGSFQDRFDQLLQAIRQIYASAMNEDALAYRLQRGLAGCDEQMALLVQRVSGSNRGAYFFPDLGGVALSHNLYVWRDDMIPEAGMIRMVLGLGTRAVDRSGDDYAKFIALDQPLRKTESNLREQRTFTQHDIDLLDLRENHLKSYPVHELIEENLIYHLPYFAERVTDHTETNRSYWVLNFQKLLGETPFPQVMREMLQTIQAAYEYPVDTEFTANFYLEDRFRINLLQCRPLQVNSNQRKVELPAKIPEEQVILFSTRFMGGNQELQVGRIIFISPEEYAALPNVEKYQIARLIGRLNRLLSSQNEIPTILLGPGRWGTSTPSLGIPITFAEINQFVAIGEIAFSTSGYTPELSFGSHFFQDLVETGIFYLGLDEGKDKSKVNRAYFDQQPNILVDLLPDDGRWAYMVHVIDTRSQEVWLHADVTRQKAYCWHK